jgi:hypothetical protein
MTRTSGEYGGAWIVSKAGEILATYGGQAITVRQLYYRLVSIGLPNNIQSYKRVVKSTTEARWQGKIAFEAFLDRERSLYGRTEADKKDLDSQIDNAKGQLRLWMESYNLERWSNQPDFVELWVEKKAIQGVFERVCRTNRVGMFPCKGYPSLTSLNEARQRFEDAELAGKNIVIIYAGDYDPSGEDIPRAIKDNLARLGVEVEVDRIALNPEQIAKWGLPGVPAKESDSRAAAWDGAGAVELDAVEPAELVKLAEAAIMKYWDAELGRELRALESKERAEYRAALKDFVNNTLAGED